MDTPLRRPITSRAELGDALLDLLGRAQRCLRCCSFDASLFDLDAPALVAGLSRFLRERRGARAWILVDQTLWIESRAPRVQALRRSLGHALQVRAAHVQDAVAGDIQWLIDDRHGLVLKPGTMTAGEIWLHSEHRVRPLVADFDRRWAAAAHDLPRVPLGL